MFSIENIEQKFNNIVNSSEWEELQSKFNKCDDVYVLGHGGNLAIADHTAVDITRLSNGQKNAISPGSAIVATSLINDTNFDQWLVNWLSHRTKTRTKKQIKNSLVYGISSSGKSKDVLEALQWANDNNMETVLITGQKPSIVLKNTTVIVLNTEFYHTCEVLSLLLQYYLTHNSGRECPAIGKNSPEELEKLNWNKGIRKHSYPDELVNIAIDFDGVIHKNSKGFYDGTIYDDPVEGAYESLEKLSKKYTVIVFSAKARSDRGLVNGKTGIELIWKWLEKHNMSQFVSKVTSEKPRAVKYIDDKAIKFLNWNDALKEVEI